ncbi:MAG: hypothetical protein AAFR16_01910 [Pseudomonadota bacterium]
MSVHHANDDRAPEDRPAPGSGAERPQEGLDAALARAGLSRQALEGRPVDELIAALKAAGIDVDALPLDDLASLHPRAAVDCALDVAPLRR